MAVTIKDVAKKAGVSYSTVSRALNDPNADKSDKKKRILKIAEEMGYVPNQAAIQLKMSRSYVIGLYFSTISKMSSPFVLHDVLTGVYSVVGSKYNVIVKGIDMQELMNLGDQLKAKLGDGVILLASENGGKVSLLAMATDGAMKQGAHAGNLIKAVAKLVGGGGGGRPNMAQAGGKNPAGINQALEAGAEELAKQLH